jgi:hypothetical protein
MLRNVIDDTSAMMTNEYVVQNIIPELVDKFNRMPSITDSNKKLINQFYQNIQRSDKPILSKKFSMKGGSSNVLERAIAYYLSNINKYDGVLVNHAVSYGLAMDKIIVLVLINNIHDVKLFCEINNLSYEQTKSITKLKKLSALYNLENNF